MPRLTKDQIIKGKTFLTGGACPGGFGRLDDHQVVHKRR
jgi:hypothetical protein